MRGLVRAAAALTFLLALVMAVSLFGCDKKEPAPAQDCLASGQQALNQRDFKQAAKLFAACAEAQPRQASAHFWLGMAHFLAHEPQKAVPAFSRCLELDPGHVQAMAMLGKLYSFDRDKLKQAHELLSKALAQRSDLEDARFDLARVLALQGQYDRSFQEFNHLFQGELRFALYHTELGKILLALGLKPQARQEFERALKLQPDFEPAQRQLKEMDQPAAPAAPAK
ncbi:MAG: tetratricopeptide repeat protein [Desulfarculus sp.]|nr:tetratricopeptide repeat protein [Desulfarculus sp.]